MFSDKAVLGRLDELEAKVNDIDLKIDAVIGVLNELMTPSVIEPTTPEGRRKNKRGHHVDVNE